VPLEGPAEVAAGHGQVVADRAFDGAVSDEVVEHVEQHPDAQRHDEWVPGVAGEPAIGSLPRRPQPGERAVAAVGTIPQRPGPFPPVEVEPRQAGQVARSLPRQVLRQRQPLASELHDVVVGHRQVSDQDPRRAADRPVELAEPGVAPSTDRALRERCRPPATTLEPDPTDDPAGRCRTEVRGAPPELLRGHVRPRAWRRSIAASDAGGSGPRSAAAARSRTWWGRVVPTTAAST
jgi:hypothetical protein